MLTFDAARERILADAPRMSSERVPVSAALGRVLAETLLAPDALPPFDHSAMDGYAVASGDFAGDGPWSLQVEGESRTGGATPLHATGTACRIFTGARVPEGTDCVVMQEDVTREDDRAIFVQRPPRGLNVRRRGEDLAAGAVALGTGTRLTPGSLGLCAAVDRAVISVARRPVVTIVCTGDELRAAGEAGAPGAIPESNGVAIAAWVHAAGGEARVAQPARDDLSATTRALIDALEGSDLLVTVGGVSVGDHDVVKPALEAAGVTLDFWKVAMRPGKPLVWGRRGDARVLGLPGNPASAQVTFALFGVPWLRAVQGDRRAVPVERHVTVTTTVRQKPGRRGFVRARLEGDRATSIEGQASGSVPSMAWADALIVLPEDGSGYEAGERARAIVLGDLA